MTTLIDNTNKFSTALPSLQRAWDSTSLKLLQECPRKYQYQMLLGRQPRGTSIHLSFGIAYHSALELFQHALADGADRHEALRTAIRFCLQWTAPGDHDPYKNLLTLCRTVVWHCEEYWDDALPILIMSNGEPAVELSFRFNLEADTPDGEPFLYCGHLDKVMTDGDDIVFGDYKTTKSALYDSYFDQFTPNTQMSGYFAATQLIFHTPARYGIIDAAQLLVNSSRFGRRPVHRTPGQLSEWHTTVAWWLSQAQRFAEENFWPMNENSCGNFGGCSFRHVCARDPGNRDRFLAADYEQWDWNPLVIRGDV